MQGEKQGSLEARQEGAPLSHACPPPLDIFMSISQKRLRESLERPPPVNSWSCAGVIGGQSAARIAELTCPSRAISSLLSDTVSLSPARCLPFRRRGREAIGPGAGVFNQNPKVMVLITHKGLFFFSVKLV